MARGTLRIYLGAAPGVGKTVAMLDEGRRRLARGTDVVVAFAETHGRAHTAKRPRGPARGAPQARRATADADFEELDLAAVLERRPAVALVDELAHTNVPGSGPHERRWQDVETLLDAGIDVISTLNVQHLESLNDVVEPDHRRAAARDRARRRRARGRAGRARRHVARGAAPADGARQRLPAGTRRRRARQLLPRRQPHRAARARPALARRPRSRRACSATASEHGITGTWETKERVVVALTGGPEGETLIRRAARIASRTAGGELLAVHVARSDGLSGSGCRRARPGSGCSSSRSAAATTRSSATRARGPARLRAARGRDPDRARAVAPQPAGRPRSPDPAPGPTVTRLSGHIDVHLVTHDQAAGGGRALPRLTGGLTARRRLAGLLLGGGAAAGADPDLHRRARHAALRRRRAAVPAGGRARRAWSAASTRRCSARSRRSLLLNYYFVEPLHTFTISEPSNARRACSSSCSSRCSCRRSSTSPRGARCRRRGPAPRPRRCRLSPAACCAVSRPCRRCSSGRGRPSPWTRRAC